MPSDMMNELVANAMAQAEANNGVEPGTYGTVKQNPTTTEYVRAGLGTLIDSNPIIGPAANLGLGALLGDEYTQAKARDAEVMQQVGESTGLGDIYGAATNIPGLGDAIGLAGGGASRGAGKAGAAAHELFEGLF